MNPLRRRAWVVGLLALLPGCERAPPEGNAWSPDIPFDTARGWIHTAAGDSVGVLAELARRETQRGLGLMYREALDSASGMLFLWDSVRSGADGFWMWRTRIPLDSGPLTPTGSSR